MFINGTNIDWNHVNPNWWCLLYVLVNHFQHW